MRKSAKIEVPVWVAATSPFTLILLDDGDELNATLEQINRNTYDRLKLCRTSAVVDPGIPAMSGIGAIVSYSTAFLFPRMRGVDKQDVVEAINRIFFQLMFGGIQFDAVSPDDIGFGHLYETGYFIVGGGASGPNFRFLVALQHQDASTFDTVQLIEPRAFTKKQLADAIVAGQEAATKLAGINPSMFLDGITNYKKFQLSAALLFLWSSIESVLDQMWTTKVIPRGAGISGRKNFVESNAWQAAYKAEVLFQIGAISEHLYGMLNHARLARNGLVHRGTTPDLLACERALRAMFALVSLRVTDHVRADEYDLMVQRLLDVHKPLKGPVDPKFWREIPEVPGDDKWGDKPYPDHPEIRLQPINKARK